MLFLHFKEGEMGSGGVKGRVKMGSGMMLLGALACFLAGGNIGAASVSGSKTGPFHAGNRGSNPLGDAKLIQGLTAKPAVSPFFLPNTIPNADRYFVGAVVSSGGPLSGEF